MPRRRWHPTQSKPNDQLTLDLRDMSDTEREAALRACFGKTSKPNKLGAKSVQEDGYDFPSQAERDRYLELKFLQQCGEITDLKVHEPVFVLQDKFRDRWGQAVRDIKYTPDNSYYKDGILVIEDVKGRDASAYPDFKLRIKLLKKRYPEVDIQIVYMTWDRKTHTWYFKSSERA